MKPRRTYTHPRQLTLVLWGAPRSADELLRRLAELGLRSCTSCRLTRNRNVMVSYGDGELRVHEGYLDAADDVWSAIVGFVEARSRAQRLAARRRLLSFPIETAPRTRSRANSHPADVRFTERLVATHGEYNRRFFGGALRSLKVRVSRRMRARLGQYTAATSAGDPPEIAISRRHIRRDGWAEALRTLLHEMVHQWQDENGLRIDHGAAFKGKAREIGVAPHARRTVAA